MYHFSRANLYGIYCTWGVALGQIQHSASLRTVFVSHPTPRAMNPNCTQSGKLTTIEDA